MWFSTTAIISQGCGNGRYNIQREVLQPLIEQNVTNTGTYNRSGTIPRSLRRFVSRKTIYLTDAVSFVMFVHIYRDDDFFPENFPTLSRALVFYIHI